MKRILLLLLILVSTPFFGQTYQTWRTEATDNIWQTNDNWWNFPNGSPIVFGQQEWDNNHQLTQQSNADVSTWRFLYKSGASSTHTFTGNKIRFFDFGGQNPSIINDSSVNQNINNNIEGDGDIADPLEIRANNGNLTFNGTINNMGSWIDIYGVNGKSVSFTGAISGSAGLTVKENSTVTISNANNTYAGVTSVEAGTLVVQKGGHSASITTSAIAFTFASTNQAAGVYDFLPGQLGGNTSRTLTSNLVAGKTVTFNYATGDVTICDLSTAPTGVIGTTTICSGTGTSLTVNGGSKGTAAVTQWFTGSCGGTLVGTGDVLNTENLFADTTYFVRYSGTCNNTTCAQVTVTITPLTTNGSVTTSICAGETYVWPANGQSYTTAQTNVTHVVGCNTATLNLTITPLTTNGSVTASICAGETYVWPANGQSYTTAQTNVTHVVGCNTATLNLTITPLTTTGSVTTSICAGETYVWPANGQSYTTAQTNLIHVVGCNTATLNLTITPQPSWYLDADADGYYVGSAIVQCSSPGAGYTLTVTGAGDCNDANDAIHPGAAEVCFNNIDDDCDGLFSEDCPPILTSIPSYTCGTTLDKINSTITAKLPTNAGGYLIGYMFRITNLSTNVTVDLPRSIRSFQLTMTNIANYNTSYLVSVAAIVNGEVQAFSTPCTISTPSIPTSNIARCGTAMAGLTSNVVCYSVTSAIGYQFEISLASDPLVKTEIIRSLNSFTMVSLNGLIPLYYDTDYSVRVKVKVLIDGIEVWGDYGSSCIVTTPLGPEIFIVGCVDPSITPASMTTNLFANSVTGATMYRFTLVNTELGYEQVIEKPLRYFNLAEFNTLSPLVLGEVYSVFVDAMIYGAYNLGKDCSITIPGGLSKMRDEVVGFEATAYPNPFANNFMIDVKTSSQSSIGVKVFDMVGRLVDQSTLNVSELKHASIGDQYPSGVYNVIITQDEEVKTLRVFKR